MSKTRRIRCPFCGSLDTKRNGKYKSHQHYYCKNCESYFTDRREHISDRNMYVWFERWILGKQSIARLSEQSHYSERTLKRYLYKQLPTCPQWQIQRREKVNLLIDGTYFTNKVCLLLYRDNNIKMTILYRLTKGEALRDLKEDLQNIKNVGIQIESVTCDGAANILKAVREVCPEAVLQRCTFHISHEIQMWLTKKPKSEAGRELLELVRYLNRIETNDEAQLWMRSFIDWYRSYDEFINEKSRDEESGRWWYTHKLLRRRASHIMRALPDMFSYTRYENIPKTSNSIESFFGHLKDHLRMHRGLSEQHFKDFVKWYLYLQSNRNKSSKD